MDLSAAVVTDRVAKLAIPHAVDMGGRRQVTACRRPRGFGCVQAIQRVGQASTASLCSPAHGRRQVMLWPPRTEDRRPDRPGPGSGSGRRPGDRPRSAALAIIMLPLAHVVSARTFPQGTPASVNRQPVVGRQLAGPRWPQSAVRGVDPVRRVRRRRVEPDHRGERLPQPLAAAGRGSGSAVQDKPYTGAIGGWWFIACGTSPATPSSGCPGRHALRP
jgi:hypothetical protein